jgi:LacI family transcriptional regulator
VALTGGDIASASGFEPVAAHPPTLADVATLAGVSLKTASRVVNAEPYVSGDKRARVEAAAESLGYRVNQAASMLKRGILSTELALIVGDLANPFYAGIAKGMESTLRGRGMYLTLASSDESEEEERRLLGELSQRGVYGIALVSTLSDHRDLAELDHRGIQLVLVDRPAVGLAADSVVLDNFGGGRLATEHLLRRGHRRIAFVGDYARLATYLERSRGFLDALGEAGVAGADAGVHGGVHGAEEAYRLTRRLLTADPAPTAIVAGNNRLGLGVLQAVTDLAVEVAVVSFDEVDYAPLLGMTTVSHPPEHLGEVVAELLLAARPRTGSTRQVVLPMTLSERGSGERSPGL